ncbi:MAG: tRNA-dihydrouridine(20/20a) synthase [Alphaproteobacteria bacterium MarineAlpha2_Bin1]|nr:MAG: tRNA-dihydrouridine(20/20a) synthase [Alphaproteobacteria bacterium MarineAlpha2_Bin1]|tara:strand:- start:614 stop:1585 length:972 start_codon:yes stop_codon:yes gene_type:complete
MQTNNFHQISIAPMMGKTDTHFRYLSRILSKNIFLYTEMITTGAILYGRKDQFLRFNHIEKPLSLQLGGSDPVALKECVHIAVEYNYDEVNLNIGCPSERVKKGNFGACLMEHPKIVAECVKKMSEINIPITVKCRIGTDNLSSYNDLKKFINIVSQNGGCKTFIIHARIADLSGLSPKQNRDIPPLQYDYVYKIKNEFPDLKIIINGGIKNIPDMKTHLNYVDGTMIGRVAYKSPWIISSFDEIFYNLNVINQSRYSVIKQYLEYSIKRYEEGIPLYQTMKHVMGLFQGIRDGKKIRRYISENLSKHDFHKNMKKNILSLVN